jgi:hypothetical protein
VLTIDTISEGRWWGIAGSLLKYVGPVPFISFGQAKDRGLQLFMHIRDIQRLIGAERHTSQ